MSPTQTTATINDHHFMQVLQARLILPQEPGLLQPGHHLPAGLLRVHRGQAVVGPVQAAPLARQPGLDPVR